MCLAMTLATSTCVPETVLTMSTREQDAEAMKRQRELDNDSILQEEEHAVEWHSLWVWLIVEF